MKTTTIGDLISGLVEAYERQYEDHELATVKAALVVDDLLRTHRGRTGVARSAPSARPMRGGARHLA